ncbi:GNAT family N-acetyltransferase [Paenibacillus senegalensis]|uniref:GNAT family N-acetyltransferase n=1 Tax=Paenibacillus senegalensis TaxID=1465766 RepID=UPI0002883117|nr:GNAT family N-acetyltransferase [Paenibacillus senegalensis]
MYKYRDARKEDFDTIASFPQNAREQFYMFPNGTYPVQGSQLYEVSLQRHLPTVLLKGSEIVGYSVFYGWEQEKCHLGNFVVAPSVRGQGAARFLLMTMLKRAKEELKVSELHLVCHNPNTAALLLYTSVGFVPYSVKKMKDGEGQQLAGISMKIDLR